MTRAPIAGEGARAEIDHTLRSWMSDWRDIGGPVALEHQPHADDQGRFHWLTRFPVAGRAPVTIWWSLRQRTVHVEAEILPPPEERAEELFAYLLSKNYTLREVTIARGPEDGVYLATHVPAGDVTASRVDEIVGAILHYADEISAVALTISYPSWRRPKRV